MDFELHELRAVYLLLTVLAIMAVWTRLASCWSRSQVYNLNHHREQIIETCGKDKSRIVPISWSNDPTGKVYYSSTTTVKFESETEKPIVDDRHQIKTESCTVGTQTTIPNVSIVPLQQLCVSCIAWKFHETHTQLYLDSNSCGESKENKKKFYHMLDIQAKLIENRQLSRAPLYPENSKLLICVDACPTQVGGYCIDFDQRIAYWYTYGTNELPWKLANRSRPGFANEFEMKNLLFALLLWEDKIKDCKDVQIYTDSSAVNQFDCSHGQRVQDMIRHFKVCERVRVNPELYWSRSENIYDFAKFITPADDLSRGRISKCEDFLRDFYGVETFVNLSSSFFSISQQVPLIPSDTPAAAEVSKHAKVVERLEWWINNHCKNCRFGLTDSNTWTGNKVCKL